MSAPTVPTQIYIIRNIIPKIGRFLFRYRGAIGTGAFVLLFIIANPKPVLLLYSIIPIIIGLALRLWAKGYIGHQSSGSNPLQLATAGPYYLVRNPLYAGNFFLTTGVLLASGLPLYGILAGLGFFVLEYFFIIRAEETLLAARFLKEYEQYKNRTGMIFPKKLALDHNWSKGFVAQNLTGEIKTGLSVAVIYLLLFVRILF